MDRSGFPDYYSGWTYDVGEMPAATTAITTVPLQADMAIQGKLSIGDSAVVPDGYKLAVRGKVVAGELKIQDIGSWPDYVFDSSYHLMPLQETDRYIKTYKHLPGVPSARKVKQEGLEVGANQALLLKKIEELTLHIIEQDKRIRKLESRLEKEPR
ncbi:hypothetical protein [Niabella hibiscisoli]|uniref:hypothetical protein n=1 Tax=Niabella hibiscisoli TaxID=1825928 RepID=UPI001F0D4602|nr:hypothetical protein [Niabella hibiscisoli]MCH5718229.1 hypothetical protein [Niabella hibiscisoli]